VYQDNNSSGLLAGFVFGAAVGMAVGLLLAPKPGVAIRKAIQEQVNQGVERVSQLRVEPK
jgi:gas vesicle protein